MAYRFKLEALRRYRQYEEERLQKQLAEAVRRREDAAGALNDLLAQQSATESELHHNQNHRPLGSHVCMYVRYLQRLEGKIAAQREHLCEVEKEVDRNRDDLMEAVKKRKTLDTLKEKGLKAYIAALDHEELKFINEIAINRFSSNQ
jgi:flagellar protein FliJ